MKLAFLVDNLGRSQQTVEMAKAINLHLEKDYLTDIVVFYDNLTRPFCTAKFAQLMSIDAYTYDGPIIATTLNTAQKLLGLPGPSAKYFYVYDLEWLRIREKNFEELQGIYTNPNLGIINRTQHHKDWFERAWHTKSRGICREFSITDLIKTIQEGV